jgi:hypothetical protein
MNTRKKGSGWVKEIEALFKEWGYTTWKPGLKAHFIGKGRVVSQSQDIFECFDLVASSAYDIVWIQSKDLGKEGHASEARKKIDKLVMPPGAVRVVTSRIPNKPFTFKVWIDTGDGWSRPLEMSRKKKFADMMDEMGGEDE